VNKRHLRRDTHNRPVTVVVVVIVKLSSSLSFVVVDVVLSSLLIGRLVRDVMYHVTLPLNNGARPSLFFISERGYTWRF